MTTQTEARKLKDAYRSALASGAVARNRETFRYGGIVRFVIRQPPSYDAVGNVVCEAAPVGEFQLRYYSTPHRLQPSTAYGVFARMEGSGRDEDWIPVDGPWQVDKGPFDNERKPLSWTI